MGCASLLCRSWKRCRNPWARESASRAFGSGSDMGRFGRGAGGAGGGGAGWVGGWGAGGERGAEGAAEESREGECWESACMSAEVLRRREKRSFLETLPLPGEPSLSASPAEADRSTVGSASEARAGEEADKLEAGEEGNMALEMVALVR